MLHLSQNFTASLYLFAVSHDAKSGVSAVSYFISSLVYRVGDARLQSRDDGLTHEKCFVSSPL